MLKMLYDHHPRPFTRSNGRRMQWMLVSPIPIRWATVDWYYKSRQKDFRLYEVDQKLCRLGLTWLQHTLQEQKATHQKPCKKYRESETVCRVLPCCTLYDFVFTIFERFFKLEHGYPWLDATEYEANDQIKPSPTLKIIFQTTFLSSCNGKAKDEDEGKVENSVANPKAGCQTVDPWPRKR